MPLQLLCENCQFTLFLRSRIYLVPLKKKQTQNSLFDVSFCPCIIFQILFICLSVLSYSSLNLRWLIFLSGSLYICILGCLPQRFILFLWWYLVSLILYVPWVLALLSLHLKKSPSPPVLTSWPWETKKLAQLEFRASLRPFLWVCLLHSSHSLTVGKIRIICFLSVLQSQYECGKPPIYFPQGSALKCSKLRTFSELGGSSQLLTSMCTKLLGIHVHHLPESVGSGCRWDVWNAWAVCPQARHPIGKSLWASS